MLIDTLMNNVAKVPMERWHWITPWLMSVHYLAAAGLIGAVIWGLWRRKR